MEGYTISGMPITEYHAHDAMSKTRLDLFARDGNSLEWAEKCPVDQEKKKALDFGDAMHAICLEPDRLHQDFAVLPDLNLRTNAGKEEKREFLEENKDKTILSFEDQKKLELMHGSVMAHPMARSLLTDPGEAELSCFWTDEKTGIPCRCRPDKIIDSSDLIIDVKTTPLLSKFKYSVEDYRYHLQNAFYLEGVNHCGLDKSRMWFIVIQSTIEMGRYPVMIWSLPSEIVQYGRDLFRQNLDDYAAYLDTPGMAQPKELDMHPGFFARMDDTTIQEIY